MNGLQTGLDIAGLIPGFGEAADGINGLIYLYRGDYLNASLSFAAMVPFVGWGATGGKLINKTAKNSKYAVEGIYEFTATSGKTYVGQSKNISNRLEQHIKSGKLSPDTQVITTEVLGGKTAREIAEQKRINSLGGIYQNGIKVLENIRNPIGASRQHLLQ